MSALSSQSPLRYALTRLLHGETALPAEKTEQCDGCRRVLSLRQVELVGQQILCADCVPSEFTTALHPHLPTHPHLHSDTQP